ncbi:IpaD/SipD/SspD family type III secretion system needle tip protein, partial [Escherichia coli]|nr:IpaD/SipD/SspD family type III secretion system needle tip protein [Escherichia coli]
MINKDNNLNIDILRQQNANIPLQEASSQSEEPHQLENSKSEGNLYNSASKDNNIGAMLKKDVEKLSTLVSERGPRNEDWKCQHDIQLNFVKNMLRNFPTENLSEKGSALLHESYLLIKNVLQLTENVNTIDVKLKDTATILTLHNSVRKTLANVAHNTTGSSAMATTKGTLNHAIASLDSSVPEMRSSATSSTLTASSSNEFK